MGWLSVLICAVPLYFLYNTGQPILWALAFGNVIVNFWSYGIMHNYAVNSSANRIKQLQENLAFEGRLDSKKEHEQEIDSLTMEMDLLAIPSWLTTVNMITTLVGIIFLCYGIWLIL